eukprot:10304442-Alexandrium_andersonii.AAC.1
MHHRRPRNSLLRPAECAYLAPRGSASCGPQHGTWPRSCHPLPPRLLPRRKTSQGCRGTLA